MMKHFIYDKPNAAPLRGDHNLQNLWKQARLEIATMIEQYGGVAEEKALKKLDKFVSRLHLVDPNGEAFRFPETLQRSRYLEDYAQINIQPIYESAKEAEEIFTWFVDARSEIRADEAEAMQETDFYDN